MGPAFARGGISTPTHLCRGESGTPPPGVLLAHSCLCWCLACDPGVSVARKCVQHALVPPHLLCRIPNTFLQQLKISSCNSKVETETDRKSSLAAVNLNRKVLNQQRLIISFFSGGG